MKAVVWKLSELAEMIKQRQANEYDVNIIIDGARGNGKSTLAFKLFSKIGNFNPKKDILFTREDVMDAIMNRTFSCIDADEMINSAHNRDFFSGDQKNFIKMMNMYRDNYNVLIGSSPFFYDLDTQVRKLIKMRITVIKRGVAIVQMSRNSLYTNDPWDTSTNKKVEESWTNKSKQGKMLTPKYTKLTTYAGHLFYSKLSPSQERIYKELKQTKRAELKLTDVELEKEKPYWVEANQLIAEGRIKKFKELEFYLMGRKIHPPNGKGKIAQHRRELNLPSLKEMWKEIKEERKQEKADSIF